jgi:hypothetical protein
VTDDASIAREALSAGAATLALVVRASSRHASSIRRDRLIRRCCVSLALIALSADVALDASSEHGWRWVTALAWTLASAAYFVTVGAELTARSRAALAAGWSQLTAPWTRRIASGCARRLAIRVRRGFCELGPTLRPGLLLLGPIALLSTADAISSTAANAAVGVVMAASVLWLLGRIARRMSTYANAQVVTIAGGRDLVFGILMWGLVGVCLAVVLGWPAPDRTTFGTLAQVDATLLVAAALVSDVPPDWQETPLAWIAGAVTVMTVGLLAALAGALGHGNAHLLGVLSVSPVGPGIAAFLVAAHARTSNRPSAPGE